MVRSFVLKLMVVFLSVVSLWAATVSAAEISAPDGSSRTRQDDADSLAPVHCQVLVFLYEAEAYLSCKQEEPFHQPFPIFRHTYRGPPRSSRSVPWGAYAGCAIRQSD